MSRHKVKSLTQRPSYEQGFTLVELLVVIAIIAILTAIAVPVFLEQRKSAADATLKSDLRNAVASIVEADLSAEEFWELFNKSGVNGFGTNAIHGLASPADWNAAVPDVPPIQLSDGTVIAIYMYRMDAGDWSAHKNGDYCLQGANSKSHFDYVPGAGGGGINYHKYLYFDPQYGGLATVQELAQALNDGQDISCTGAVRAYVAAHA